MSILPTIGVRAPRTSTSSIFERATNAATQVGLQKIQSRIPASTRRHLPLARSLLARGVSGLSDALLNRAFERLGINGTLLPGQAVDGPSELIGGLTLAKVRELHETQSQTEWSKKNLWMLRIRNLQGGSPLDINMFAIDVSYNSYTVQGEAVLVGSGSFDNATNSERVELRVTTMDNAYGEVKRWFKERHDMMCHADGTFGLPVEYLFRVDILHAYCDESVENAQNGFVDTFIMRPGAMDFDLSRREDAMQEIQMTFVQWDTFAALA